MKDRTGKVLAVIAGIVLNIFGSFLVSKFKLPLWLDMTGTCVASYFAGMWGGIVAGISKNLFTGLFDVTSLIYSLTSLTAAVVIHFFIKRGYMENVSKALVSSFWLGILCTIVSTPLNFIFYNGYSGNIWGDALVDMLKWYGASDGISALAGEAIVEIVDRQLCVMLAYVIICNVDRSKVRNLDRIKAIAFVFAIGIVAYSIQRPINALAPKTKMWEMSWYTTYLIIVCLEIFLFTVISIENMILFAMRKNELELQQIELERKVQEQTEELRIQQRKTPKLFVQTVTALSEAVDAKDRYTSGHSKRVAVYALKIAERMGKSREEQEEIYRAGLLHDVGKIRIPREIINKKGKLTGEEFNIIKIHTVTGYHILRGISDSELIAMGAKFHHERYDGGGYPNGLIGKQIPEVARILGVADSYDAMTSDRSYRKAMSQETVRREIENGRGTQFDPDIADIMLQMIDEDKDFIMKQGDSLQRKILVVDDEPMNGKLITNIMRDEPMYEIVPAYGGREALEILEDQAVDLILLDVRMPGMDGLETLKYIREKYQMPVAIMTGDRNLDTIAEFAKLGCDDYITKPFPPLLIREIVHHMTERAVVN